MNSSWLALSLALVAVGTLPAVAAKKPVKHLLVVTVTKGFRHDSIPLAEEIIERIGKETGDWETDFVRTDEEMQTKMTPEALKRYDAVCFASTTGTLPLPDPNGFLQYIRDGHGFIAMHAGSDTFHEWPGQQGGVSEYIKMLGAEFQTHHSQSSNQPVILDPSSPATRPLIEAAHPVSGEQPKPQPTYVTGNRWHTFDEMYLFKNVDRPALHVLVYMDKHPDDGSPEANQPGEYLIAWVKSYGKGRVFYTSLGHRQDMWNDPLYQKHITGGIRFALGLARGNTKPNQPLSASQ